MTTVEINRSGTDQVTLEVVQSGSSESSVSLRHDLLDGNKQYHFCVSSLSVPLNGAPIFKLTGPVELFRIERRNIGQSINAPLHLLTTNDSVAAQGGGVVAAGAVVPDAFSVFSIRPDETYFDVSSFLKKLSNFTRGFNDFWTRNTLGNGFAPIGDVAYGDPIGPDRPGRDEEEMADEGRYSFLGTRMTADGKLQFVGDHVFWNNFVFRFTTEGAARLGFYDKLQAVNRVGGPGNFALNDAVHYYIARTKDAVTGAYSGDWLNGNGQILAGNHLQEVIISSGAPIFENIDQRVKVSVESHLPTPSNATILDEVEGVNRTVAEAYFENKLNSQIRFGESGQFENLVLTSQMYGGQFNFIRKSDRTFQWTRLNTAENLRLFRFQIYIWHRVWNNTRNRWALQKSKLVVQPHQFFELEVRFVSDS